MWRCVEPKVGFAHRRFFGMGRRGWAAAALCWGLRPWGGWVVLWCLRGFRLCEGSWLVLDGVVGVG